MIPLDQGGWDLEMQRAMYHIAWLQLAGGFAIFLNTWRVPKIRRGHGSPI